MTIAVYNVVLKSEIIVGVGPLCRVQRNDVVAMAHRELRFQFDLYCTNYRITITTDPLSFDGPAKDASAVEYDKIREVWERIRENLANDLPMDTGFGSLASLTPKSMPGV